MFHYIDGAADDEITKDRNTAAFDDVDLVPNVLAGVRAVDPSVTVLGKTTRLPLMLSPTALQRLFHWQGERAVAAAAEKFGLWFGISSLASVGIEEIGAKFTGPKMLQYYYHKDKGLNAALLETARAAKFDAVALTVDTIVGGNRERCLRTGFTSPPRITPASALSYAIKPRWALDYLFREKFSLPNLERARAARLEQRRSSIARLFQPDARPVDGLGARPRSCATTGAASSAQGHHVGRRRAARGGDGRATRSWSPTTAAASSTAAARRSTSSPRSSTRSATGWK